MQSKVHGKHRMQHMIKDDGKPRMQHMIKDDGQPRMQHMINANRNATAAEEKAPPPEKWLAESWARGEGNEEVGGRGEGGGGFAGSRTVKNKLTGQEHAYCSTQRHGMLKGVKTSRQGPLCLQRPCPRSTGGGIQYGQCRSCPQVW